MNFIKRIRGFVRRMSALSDKVNLIQEALGRIELRQIEESPHSISGAEFRVFSQWGEDGIIQYLLRHVEIPKKIFVEFGVENYEQSNTRFLITNDYWSGLVIDGSVENISYIKNDVIYWARNLKAECSFITKENINEILLRNGISGEIGLLSIDIDGNDYWVWDAIDCIDPRIVICEYNSHFVPTAKVTTPYDPGFIRDSAHSSRVYYGASIAALSDLATKKGYSLVAGNLAGNNVFFVRNDLLGNLKVVAPQDVYTKAHFREYHDEDGKLTFDDFETRVAKIRHLPLYDLKTHVIRTYGDLIR